jgi:hypothetical protein
MTRRTGKCPGCGHAWHRDLCPCKGPSGCVPLLNPATGQPRGFACSGTRAPCPCPFGWCHTCLRMIAGASTLPLYDGSPEINIERGSAGAPDGTWAVWKLADGTLGCRVLADGEQPAEREWRGREHTACRAKGTADDTVAGTIRVGGRPGAAHR